MTIHKIVDQGDLVIGYAVRGIFFQPLRKGIPIGIRCL
jgi:hypothetical protein